MHQLLAGRESLTPAVHESSNLWVASGLLKPLFGQDEQLVEVIRRLRTSNRSTLDGVSATVSDLRGSQPLEDDFTI
jgi:hypothetical protein